MSYSISYSVILPYPVQRVFPILSERQHLERFQSIIPGAQDVHLLPSDQVRLPESGLKPLFHPEHPTNQKGLPRPVIMDAVPSDQEEGVADTKGGQLVERIKFNFSRVNSAFFGLMKVPYSLTAAQVVEKETRTVLFESILDDSGMTQLKVRTFEEVTLDDGREGTKVKETMWGTCPLHLLLLVKMLAPGVHREHMDLYHTLFE